jgi:hypothetical protein
MASACSGVSASVIQVKSMQDDELLGRQVDEQLPERLLLAAGPEVPDRVHHRARRHVQDALLGPSQRSCGSCASE